MGTAAGTFINTKKNTMRVGAFSKSLQSDVEKYKKPLNYRFVKCLKVECGVTKSAWFSGFRSSVTVYFLLRFLFNSSSTDYRQD